VSNKKAKLIKIKLSSSYEKAEELKTYEKTLKDSIHERGWRDAIQTELKSLQAHEVWELNKLLEERKLIECK